MPYRIEKRKGSRPYKIIKKTTNEVVGSSVTRADAEASVRARESAMNEEDHLRHYVRSRKKATQKGK